MTGDLESGDAPTLTYPSPRHTFEDVYLHMDIYKIEQVIRNLVTNAVEKKISTNIFLNTGLHH